MRGKSLFNLYFIFSQYILVSFATFPRQIPLGSNNDIEFQQQRVLNFSPAYTSSPSPLTTKANTKTFKLSQILHHGVTPSTKRLFRQLNINDLKKDELHTTEIFNEYVINSIFIDHSKENEETINGLNGREVPCHKNKSTVLSMAKMSYDAYIKLETLKDHWIDLNGDWNNLPFGWEDDGLRGYVFSDSENKTVILAIKGTSLSYMPYGGNRISKHDKFNDNLMFSCCCAKVDILWKGVCGCHKSGWNCDDTCLHNEVNIEESYYNIASKILEKVKQEYSNSNPNIWLTGHSLGGSLASLLALKYDLPAFAYQAPGELLYAKRLGLNTTQQNLPIYHFGHTTDPIFMGTCNGKMSTCYQWGFAMETKCHVGSSCLYDTRSNLGWKSNIRNHAIMPFIEKVIDKWYDITGENVAKCIEEKNCKDCQSWNFV